LVAAQYELSEEAHLKNGKWICLLPEMNLESQDKETKETKENNFQGQGISELKWGTNRFIPFLVLDPEVDETPLQRDKEGDLFYRLLYI
jgi:hypothetical protein